MIEEDWRDVEGYEGKYQVSNYGNVRSLNYKLTGKLHLMKPAKNSKGYLYVFLSKDGKQERLFIHRLVAKAFVKNLNPDKYKEVNHKSECPVLNFACVLEWCDHVYNMNYGTKVQRQANAISIPIDQFDKDGNFIRHWKSATEASKQLGINRGNMGECVNGHYKTAGGYIWKRTNN